VRRAKLARAAVAVAVAVWLLVVALVQVLSLHEERRQTCLANVAATAWIALARERGADPHRDAQISALLTDLARYRDRC
jgi:peptidoglycan/LPS O-acetylase OafA/YrhL